MEIVRSVTEMSAKSRLIQSEGKRVVLVPTMGALHEGHLELIREGSSRGDYTIVSVFVNPTQFGPEEDFEAYPRVLDEDRQKLETIGNVDVLFAPNQSDMYPDGTPLTSVTVHRMAEYLCGASREGHFSGVALVVTKLLHICGPDVAVFGLKDAQQFFLIQRLVSDLNMNVEIVGVPTVREKDGLAKSSRNKYLTVGQRAEAPVLHRTLILVQEAIEAGERDVDRLIEMMRDMVGNAPLGRLDYANIVRTVDFQPIRILRPGETVVIAIAVYFGKARLIDNSIIDVS